MDLAASESMYRRSEQFIGYALRRPETDFQVHDIDALRHWDDCRNPTEESDRFSYTSSSSGSDGRTDGSSSSSDSVLKANSPSVSLLKSSKPFACTVPNCSRSYSSKSGLRYHLEHHRERSRSSYDRQRRLQLPPELQQELDRIYDPTICPACHLQFKRKTNVIHHLKERHHGEECYRCIISGCTHHKAYATREGLVYHLANYHGTK